MPAPFYRQFLPDLSYQSKVTRSIDNHYHLEMIAGDNRQLVEYQANSLRLQHQVAIANVRAMGEITHRQDQANDLLSMLFGDIGRLNDSMDALNASAKETIDLLYGQTEVLQKGFEEIATQMMEQQRVLREIANSVRAPYETKALELLREADNALKSGMMSFGRDQEEEFKDAERLLQLVLDNPIGRRNYVVWFQTGWLSWKFKHNVEEAEEAFYQAARLSSSKADLYHAYSQRHRAYMQDLQGRSADAYDSIHKALHITPNDHDTMYDAARYATKTGQESETLELLDKCIDIRRQTIITMFSEDDFQLSTTAQQGIASLLLRKTDESRARAQRAIASWQRAVEAIRQAEKMALHEISLTNDQTQDVQLSAASIQTANYILAIDLANKAVAKRDSVLATGIRALQKEIDQRRQLTETIAKQEIEVAKNEFDRTVSVPTNEYYKASNIILNETPTKLKSGLDSGRLGIILLFISDIGFIYGFFSGFFRYSEDFFDNVFGFLVTLAALWILFTNWIPNAIDRVHYARVMETERRRIAVAKSPMQKAVDEATNRLRETTEVIEERRKKGEAHRNRAEAALFTLTHDPSLNDHEAE